MSFIFSYLYSYLGKSEEPAIEKVSMSVKNKYDHLEKKDLPRLPVPQLKDTLEKYLKTVKCLLTEEEFAETKREVENFEKGEGPKLHEELLRLAKETPTSFLEGFWDLAYLGYRVPVMIHVSPAFGLNRDPKGRNMVERASSLIFVASKYKNTISDGTISQDMERKTPLCMCQYGKLFGSNRVAVMGRDRYDEYPESKHIVVLCNQLFYKVPLYDNEGTMYREGHFIDMLNKICQDAKGKNVTHPVGVLTSSHRDEWAKIRPLLLEKEENEASVKEIESALFAVVLEPEKDLNREDDLMKELLFGDARNRWFDKSLQFIVAKDGIAGINMEHSGFDGHTIIVMCHNMINDEMQHDIPKSIEVKDFTARSLPFDLGEELKDNISRACVSTLKLIRQTSVSTLKFTEYGKGAIKKMKMSPDAFVQMSYQLAYFRLHSKSGSTYESANTKRFYHGRTEVIRSVSTESVSFTKSWDDPEIGDEEKEKLLRSAAGKHVDTVRGAKKGCGIDRHLWTMKRLAQHKRERLPDYEIPGIYTDGGWGEMTTDKLSTSNCSGSKALRWFGFGPTTSECFGVGYVVETNEIHFCVSNFKGKAKLFADMLAKSLVDMRNLVTKVMDEGEKKKKDVMEVEK